MICPPSIVANRRSLGDENRRHPGDGVLEERRHRAPWRATAETAGTAGEGVRTTPLVSGLSVEAAGGFRAPGSLTRIRLRLVAGRSPQADSTPRSSPSRSPQADSTPRSSLRRSPQAASAPRRGVLADGIVTRGCTRASARFAFTALAGRRRFASTTQVALVRSLRRSCRRRAHRRRAGASRWRGGGDRDRRRPAHWRADSTSELPPVRSPQADSTLDAVDGTLTAGGFDFGGCRRYAHRRRIRLRSCRRYAHRRRIRLRRVAVATEADSTPRVAGRSTAASTSAAAVRSLQPESTSKRRRAPLADSLRSCRGTLTAGGVRLRRLAAVTRAAGGVDFGRCRGTLAAGGVDFAGGAVTAEWRSTSEWPPEASPRRIRLRCCRRYARRRRRRAATLSDLACTYQR